MRHGNKVNHLGRTYTHRKSMLSNMACSLIYYKSINTTLAKAKELKRFVEPLLTKSKSDTTHSRRIVYASLGEKVATQILFDEIAQKIADRPGGYLRILKTGNRKGDNAPTALVELVDFSLTASADNTEAGAATRRVRRGRGGKSAENTATTTPVVEESNPKTDEAPEA